MIVVDALDSYNSMLWTGVGCVRTATAASRFEAISRRLRQHCAVSLLKLWLDVPSRSNQIKYDFNSG